MKKKLFAMTLATVLLASCFLGVTMQSEAASWQANGSRWWYSEDNGSYPANAWRFIDNAWYHFDNWGYMQTGWQVIDGSWYYFYNNGAMAANQWIGNYFVDASGQYGNKYMDWLLFCWRRWSVDSGLQYREWNLDGNGWWYRHSDGSYTTSNWEFINGNWYYFNGSGYMLTGWNMIGGSWYYFDGSGAMASNRWMETTM